MNPHAAAWFARRTSTADDWPIDRLMAVKGDQCVSVVLPALDEEDTVGLIVAGVRRLAVDTGLVDEVVVVDSGSSDGTSARARSAGATVYHRDDILPGYGSVPGKGEVLWKALAVTTGDIIVYVDADLTDFGPHFVTGLLGPLLTDPEVWLVKAFYDRPWLDRYAEGGGRVTELAARPLLNAFFPDLSGVVQPLAGEYAARRSLLAALPFASGYGVEAGLLIDTATRYGLDRVAQVDLGSRTHGHQDTAALGQMAATILQTVLRRVPVAATGTDLTQFHRCGGRIAPRTTPVPTSERPPMRTIAEYTGGC
jgi:glucosyl-3-phosphoglycerate synthase